MVSVNLSGSNICILFYLLTFSIECLTSYFIQAHYNNVLLSSVKWGVLQRTFGLDGTVIYQPSRRMFRQRSGVYPHILHVRLKASRSSRWSSLEPGLCRKDFLMTRPKLFDGGNMTVPAMFPPSHISSKE